VATLVSGAENAKLGGWMNSTPALIVNVQRQPGANVVDVVDRIQELLPSLKAAMPAGVDVTVLTDRTTTIRASVKDVEFELVLSVVLVVLVILAVPAQCAGHHHSEPVGAAVADRHLRRHVPGEFQPEQFVADGADHRHRLRGRRRHRHDREHLALHRARRAPLEAALKGAGQIGFTIISLTVSLIAVLIPLLFMQDVVGRCSANSP
jgi:multidrug efflux pump